METKCLGCNNIINITFTSLEEPPKVECDECGSVFNVTMEIKLVPTPREESQSTEETIASAEGEPEKTIFRNQKVMIAATGMATNEIINETLANAGIEACPIGTDSDLLQQITEKDPAIVILDIDKLSETGMEIIPQIKEISDIKVLILTSIYNVSRYKREPESLFGADGYIERQEIKSDLINRLNNIVSGLTISASQNILELTSPLSSDSELANITGNLAQISAGAKKKDSPITPETSEAATEESTEEDNEEILAAQRLARIIISDIALYNQQKIEDGIKNATFFKLLREEVEEGRKLYNSRVSKEIQKKGNFYKNAIMDFIKRKKTQLSQV